MRRRTVAVVMVVAAGLLLSGCATLRDQRIAPAPVTINSEPSGAEVFMGNRRVGVTPVRVRPHRFGTTVLRLEKRGFASHQLTIRRVANRWLFANLIFANPLGCQGLSSADDCPRAIASGLAFAFGTDLLTGAAYRYVAPPRVVLVPNPEP